MAVWRNKAIKDEIAALKKASPPERIGKNHPAFEDLVSYLADDEVDSRSRGMMAALTYTNGQYDLTEAVLEADKRKKAADDERFARKDSMMFEALRRKNREMEEAILRGGTETLPEDLVSIDLELNQ